jgi:hypothetical protein
VLARTAAWLDDLGRLPDQGDGRPGAPQDRPQDRPLEQIDTPFGLVRRVRCPGIIGGRTLAWGGPPSPLGSQPPRWAEPV